MPYLTWRSCKSGHARFSPFIRLLRSPTSVAFVLNTVTSFSSPANATAKASAAGPGTSSLSVFPRLQQNGAKPSSGPTFTYLCEWTLFTGGCEEVGLAGAAPDQRVMEVWRSRRTVSQLHLTCQDACAPNSRLCHSRASDGPVLPLLMEPGLPNRQPDSK